MELEFNYEVKNAACSFMAWARHRSRPQKKNKQEGYKRGVLPMREGPGGR
jgi:hypothetical protein